MDRELLDALEAEDRVVDLAGAVQHSGWESRVVESRDGWMYRFPRPHVDFARELVVLRLLSDRLPVPIPHVEWTGTRTAFAAYRKLTGWVYDVRTYERHPQPLFLARSIAGFLYAMHTALTASEVDELRLPSLDHAAAVSGVASQLTRIPGAARAPVSALLEEVLARWVELPSPEPRVVLHNDFHFGNVVLTAADGELSGVWDFSCVQLGEPTFDVRYLSKSPALLRDVASQYESLGGHPLDVRAALVAARLEMVSDALDLDEPERLPELVRSWT